MNTWINVEDHLPDVDVWVQVYEDDSSNPQDKFIANILNSFRQRVTPAKLLYIDDEGYPTWYLTYCGSRPIEHVRNVTKWKPLSNNPM